MRRKQEMHQVALERHPDGSASIFERGWQYRREPGSHGPWLKRTPLSWPEFKETAVSKSRARRLERFYRNPERAKVIRRFPRLGPEAIAAEAKAGRLAALDD